MTRLSNQKFRIEIANEQNLSCHEDQLIAAVELVLRNEGIERSEISIAVVDDPTIRQLNNQYLGHDYETDVISFLLEHNPETHFLSGQLIVSFDTATRVAAELGIETEHELLLYVVHGTLHLVGFDDQQPEAAAEIRAAERRYLKQLGIEHHWPDDSDAENPREEIEP